MSGLATQISDSSTDVYSNIQNLLSQATYAFTPSSRIKAYCDAALLQVSILLREAASHTLNIARSRVDLNSNEGVVKDLCEIAKVRLAIAPGVLPKELSEAEKIEAVSRREDAQPGRKLILLPYHAGDLCALAEAYHLAGHLDKAQLLMDAAKECIGFQSKTLEYLSGLFSIASLEKKMVMNDACVKTIDLALQSVTQLRESTLQIRMWTKFASILISLNPEKARAVISLAEKEFEQEDFSEDGESDCRREIREVLSEWQKYTSLKK